MNFFNILYASYNNSEKQLLLKVEACDYIKHFTSYDHTIKDITSKNANFSALDIIHLRSEYLDFLTDIFYLNHWFSYLYRKNKLHIDELIFDFDEKDSIVPLLEQTIVFVIELKRAVTYCQLPDSYIHDALHAIEKFKAHAHYLPHLSGNSNRHKVRNIFLYLRHTQKVVRYFFDNLFTGLIDHTHRDFFKD